MDFAVRTRNGSLNSMWETFPTWTAVLKKRLSSWHVLATKIVPHLKSVCLHVSFNFCNFASCPGNLKQEVYSATVLPMTMVETVSDQQMFNRFMSLAQNVYLTTLFSKIPKKLKYSNVQRSKITAPIRTFMFFSAEGMQIVCNLFVLCSSSSVEMKLFLGLFQVTIKGADAVKLHFFGVLLDKSVIWLFANTLVVFQWPAGKCDSLLCQLSRSWLSYRIRLPFQINSRDVTAFPFVFPVLFWCFFFFICTNMAMLMSSLRSLP